MIKDYNKIQDLVKVVLERDEKTRNSDKELLIAVWQLLGFYLSETQKQKFMSLPSVESITRARRKFQESGLYQASDKIKEVRLEEAAAMTLEMAQQEQMYLEESDE